MNDRDREGILEAIRAEIAGLPKECRIIAIHLMNALSHSLTEGHLVISDEFPEEGVPFEEHSCYFRFRRFVVRSQGVLAPHNFIAAFPTPGHDLALPFVPYDRDEAVCVILSILDVEYRYDTERKEHVYTIVYCGTATENPELIAMFRSGNHTLRNFRYVIASKGTESDSD